MPGSGVVAFFGVDWSDTESVHVTEPSYVDDAAFAFLREPSDVEKSFRLAATLLWENYSCRMSVNFSIVKTAARLRWH